MEQEKSSRIRF